MRCPLPKSVWGVPHRSIGRHAAVLLTAALVASAAGAAGQDRIRFEGGESGIREELRAMASRFASAADSTARLRLQTEMLRRLAQAGYWDGRIAAPRDTARGAWQVDFGPVYTLQDVEVRLAPPDTAEADWPQRRRRAGRDLRGMRPPQAAAIERAAADLLRFWENNGHPFASVRLAEPRLAGGALALQLVVDPGPKVWVTRVAFLGDHGTRPEFLRRWMRLPDTIDRPFAAETWERGRQRLRDSGLFASVSPPRIDQPAPRPPGSGLAARVVYRLEPGVSNRLEAAAGYSGRSETLSGLVHVALGNLFGTGRSLMAEWERRAADRTRFHLRYADPFLLWLPLRWSGEVEHVLEDTLYTRTDLHGLVSWEIERDLWLDAGARRERNVVSEALGGGRSRTSSIFGLRWEGLGRDPSRESGLALGLQWSRGRSEIFSEASRRETVDEVRLRAEVRGRLAWLGLGRARLRGAGPFLEEPAPLYETYPVGGDRSLRGYRDEAFRVLRYAVLQLEAGPRLGPGGSRLLLFVDAAWMLPWRRLADGLAGERGDPRIRGSYGVGLRSLSRRGLIRVDYGIPWGEDPTSGRLHVGLEAPF
ncbi:MAG: BamA/TamA family outer membrane protein [Candidatus Eisenbacteria bacterium]|nr:BamA/TamA family outer membrane protein [Candidatus Eisenbacteria bacterium]